MNQFTPSRHGTVFNEVCGKLYVFEPRAVTVMAAWPVVRAWRKTPSSRGWRHYRPKIDVPTGHLADRLQQADAFEVDTNGQLVLPDCNDAEGLPRASDIARDEWYRLIPREIRQIVGRYSDRQWHVLSFLARCGTAAVDLAIANPAMAWSLSTSWVFRPRVQRPLRSARALLSPGRKQREILAWLRFPATETVRKILRKVVHKSIGVSPLLYLRDGLCRPDVGKALSHLDRINAGVLRIATDPALLLHASPQLLYEISQSRKEDLEPRAAYVLRDSLNMLRLLRPDGWRFPRFVRLAKLMEIHDSLIDQLNHTKLSTMDLDFPPPPIKGTDRIVPITNARELVEEGQVQRNCVASYIEQVAVRQRVYVYRVLAPPDRCTLSVSRRGDRWVIEQLKRACNQPASEATYREVTQWMTSSQMQFEHEPELNGVLF